MHREAEVDAVSRNPERPGLRQTLIIWIAAGVLGWAVVIGLLFAIL